MHWTRFLSWLSSKPSRRVHCAKRFRPRLEGLEDRQLLTTYTLNSISGPGIGNSGDLAYCIQQADAMHNATHPAASDTIVFSKLFAKPQIIDLTSTLTLSDSHPLTIKGPAGGKYGPLLTVSGQDSVEVFDIASGKVTISNLAITHGSATTGGGIKNDGTLKLTNCTLSHDSAAGVGGGIYNNGGTIRLTNCTFTNNSASIDGGGLITEGGMVTLTSCTISNNSARTGGGVDNAGSTVALTNCTLSNNAARLAGGGLDNFFGSTATLTNCTISNNSAGAGGGIYNSSTVTLTNSTLSNNSASNSGGGIYSEATATLTSCTFNNNKAANGGGIYNQATLALTNSTLSNNAATNVGGGMENFGGTAMLTNCTISNNSTSHFGGGIWSDSTLTLTNCTLSYNAATSGGGIFIFSGASVTLTNTLVAENTATTGPDIDGAVTTADHDLIGNASGSTVVTDDGGNQLGGINTNPVIDPRLGPLQNNGGPTLTEALLPGSPAIGQVIDNTHTPKTDQRGHPRNLHKPTDIGAFET